MGTSTRQTPTPTRPLPSSSPSRGFSPLGVTAFAIALIGARLLAAHFSGFFGLDEIALANGVVALGRDSIADIYRYGPQVGYYRLVQAVDAVLGGDLRLVPHIMIVMSAIAGAVIPVCGLFLFSNVLSRTERLVLTVVLSVNPIVWMSSTYGNSAMISVMFLTIGVTIATNRPRPLLLAGGLAAFGLAILIRADSVLAFPAVALVIWQGQRSIRATTATLAPLVIGLAMVYGVMFVTDRHMASTIEAVTSHLTNPLFTTHFWDYLLWSTSPILFVLAILGARQLLDGRRDLLAVVVAWCLPFFGFYYTATTSPRYFVPTAVPLAVCTAVGAVALPGFFRRRRLATVVVAILGSAHLVVSLSNFAPGKITNLVRQGSIETHVGPLWTGALVYQSYLVPGFLARSVRNQGFHRTVDLQRSLDSLLQDVANGSARGRTIAVLTAGWNGHVFHYYALVDGAHYLSKQPGPIGSTETWMELGGARLMSIGRETGQYESMPSLPIRAGDEVWVIQPDATWDSTIRAKLPTGVLLSPLGASTRHLQRYVLSGATR